MSCARYEQWLHLHRPGELSKEDQVLLERHLAECSRCAALSTRVAAAERALARPRDPLPENPDAEAAAERVPVEPARICSVGFLIADRQAELFQLDVEWIRPVDASEA